MGKMIEQAIYISIFFKQQKKLEALAQKKLSADFFDDLPDAIPKSNILKRKADPTVESRTAQDSEGTQSSFCRPDIYRQRGFLCLF
jgi:hypothetical protein